VTGYYLWSLPGAVAATFLGRIINRRLDRRAFLVVIHVGLVGVGVVLLLQALRG
jgi:hypothetical protein